jgi:hypothetical protein
MPFAGVGGTSVRFSQYLIDNSLRFNTNDSAFLKRTNSTTGNRQKWTFSTWVKYTLKNNNSVLIYPHSASNNLVNLVFGDTLYMDIGSVGRMFQTNAVHRDPSAWYHVVVAFNTTDYATVAAGQVRVYVNGVEQTFSTTTNMSQGFNSAMNDAVDVGIGRDEGADNNYADYYLAETHLIDGQQLSPTDFGEFDEDSGIWKPIEYTGTYGTNGFYLDFENSGSLGADQSGNGNNFTPTNFTATDQTTDTPTNNFATFTPLNGYNQTLTEGNTRITASTGSAASGLSTIAPTSGKWYVEYDNSRPQNAQLGVYSLDDYTYGTDTYNFPVGKSAAITIEAGSNYSIDWDEDATGGTLLQNSTNLIEAVYGMAVDIDNGNAYFSANGNWYSSVSGAFDKSDFSDATAVFSALPTTGDVPIAVMCRGSYDVGSGFGHINFGNPPPQFPMSSSESDENGYGSFEYAPPSGYLALCTQNLATELSPTIDDGSQYFNTVLYTGNSSTNNITGVGFQPDWVWGKCRSAAQHHRLFDSSRGVLKNLITSTTNAEATTANSLTSFDSDGFTLGSDDNLNFNTRTFVAWNWKANAGSTSSNTDGSITSTVQANPTAGFSIVTWTGIAGGQQTIGHGLGAAPVFIISKNRTDAATEWYTATGFLSGWNWVTDYLRLNSTAAKATDGGGTVFPVAPTSTVFTVAGAATNGSGKNYVAYCFADIEGYSKFGSYTGNGSTDGTFVYTGFRPAMVILKRTDTTNNWLMYDNKRDPDNLVGGILFPNLSNAESIETTNNILDFTSNGFKLRSSSVATNASGGTYIYMAFAENPFVSSTGIPVVAR